MGRVSIAQASWRLRVAGLLCALNLHAATAADLTLEVIQLRHRSVEQVLTVIQPLVPAPGTVSGMQNHLIVRTTPANLADVRRVLAAIDRMPRRLMISVRHDAEGNRAADAGGTTATLGGRHGDPAAPGRDLRGRAVGGDSTRMPSRSYGTRSLEYDRSTQRLQVLEGDEAFIHIGESIPVPRHSIETRVTGGRFGERPADIVDYRDMLTGFSVRPRLSGNTVTLEISPQRDTPGAHGPGSMDMQRVATTVSGRLGEWIELGAVSSGRSFERSGTAYRSSAAADDNRRVLVKVDEVQ